MDLSKEEYAIVYRALRDKLKAQALKGEKLDEKELQLLGKLKLTLNLI